MKKKTLIVGIVFIICLFSMSCDFIAVKIGGNLILFGSLRESYTSYGSPRFTGYVKNTGKATVYNASIKITCFSDSGKTTIIDTASGFPASLGDIPPGVRAIFDAVCFDVESHSDIRATTYIIDWLNRDYNQ